MIKKHLMSTHASAPPIAAESVRPPWRRGMALWRFLRANPLALAGLLILAFWVGASLLSPLLAPYGPLAQKIVERLKPPTAAHLFGTDQLGRDVFTRVLYGGRLSLPAGIAVVIVAGLIGTAVGALAGYAGGWLDELVMRLTEVFMAFPTIILAMAIAAALGPSLVNAILAMVVVWWPNYARVVRGLVLSVKANEYVEAARVIGAPEGRVLLRTVLPNCLAPAVVMATIDLGNAVLVFAGLSFLGLGPEPSTPEWGRMVSDGIAYFDQWWMSAFPGLAIFSAVVAFNFIGDSVRDALDPRLRNG
jgi:peptide/nickel transport system permease protein